MLFTEILTLCKLTAKQDDIGQIIYDETQRVVLAKKNIVGSKEFYNAMAVGIKPTAELQILSTNYDDETECVYNNQRYTIIRTIPKHRNAIVLVLQVKENNGNGTI